MPNRQNNSYASKLSQFSNAPENIDKEFRAMNSSSGHDVAIEDIEIKKVENPIIVPKNLYSFCHLHRHCEASIQDGVGKVEDGVKYAKEMGHPAIAVTDHGNLISYVRFYNEAISQNIKHIFGLEAYVTESMEEKVKQYNHCTILVKNDEGYKNILKLNHIAQTQGFY